MNGSIVAKEKAAWDALGDEPTDEQCNAVERYNAKAADEIFKRPVTSWSDILLLACVALRWDWEDLQVPDCLKEWRAALEPSQYGYDSQSRAHLLRAVLSMGGVGIPR